MPFTDIAILGPGKFAHSLAGNLARKGITPVCVYARSLDKAKKFKKKFNIPSACDKLSAIPDSVSHIFITVSDSAIPQIVKLLIEEKVSLKNKFIWHFSGAESSECLAKLKLYKARTGSFHILQTFPDDSIRKISGYPAALESSSKICLTEMKKFANLLDLNHFIVKADKKPLYHLMGVMISNFTVANFAAAEELYNNCGINGVGFGSLAMPIVTSTIDNILRLGAVNALSGPVERQDLHVITSHLESLNSNSSKLQHLTNMYLEISKYLTKVASSKNSDSDYRVMESFLLQLKKKYS